MTADTPAPDLRRRTAVRRFVLVAVVMPLLTAAAGVITMLTVSASLPDPIAVHWGIDGGPDGFGPLWMPIVLLPVVVLSVAALLSATTLPTLLRGDAGSAARLLGALSWGLAAFLTALVTSATVAQAGLADATQSAPIWLPLVLAVAAGAVAAVAGFVIQPHRRFVPSPAAAAVPTEIADGEQVVWLQRVTMARGGLVFLVAASLLMVVITVLMWASGADPLAQTIMLLATAVIVFAVATNVAFHVRVDERGITVTSAMGWPRVHVPLSDVVDAAAVHVEPMAEFGGWGLRWGPSGRFGVVMRAGEGIEVRRRPRGSEAKGRTFTVTVDDSATGAGLLTALAATRTGS